MCFKEFLGYTCGHTSLPVLRPCPLTTFERENPVCQPVAVKPILPGAMCPTCQKIMNTRATLIEEYEHRFMHERGACDCEVVFPHMIRARVIGLANTDFNAGDPNKTTTEVPPLYQETYPDGRVAVSVRQASLYAAKWRNDHRPLHESGECKCPGDFRTYPEILEQNAQAQGAETQGLIAPADVGGSQGHQTGGGQTQTGVATLPTVSTQIYFTPGPSGTTVMSAKVGKGRGASKDVGARGRGRAKGPSTRGPYRRPPYPPAIPGPSTFVPPTAIYTQPTRQAGTGPMEATHTPAQEPTTTATAMTTINEEPTAAAMGTTTAIVERTPAPVHDPTYTGAMQAPAALPSGSNPTLLNHVPAGEVARPAGAVFTHIPAHLTHTGAFLQAGSTDTRSYYPYAESVPDYQTYTYEPQGTPVVGLPIGAGPEGVSHAGDWEMCRLNHRRARSLI